MTNNDHSADTGDQAAGAFISKWQGITASELSTSQRLPKLLEMLVVLGTAQEQEDGGFKVSVR